MSDRIILHSDLNCFYASVEMLLDPSLRGKAVAVCGSTEERHGIVLAKSELAKKAGVKTGQANWQARQACPNLIVVPPQYDEYLKFSKLVRSIYLRYTDLVEPYGMDECWLDVSGCRKLYGSGQEIAEQIRQTIKEEIGLTVSIGVSFNKIFAKLGSDMKKPDAVTVLEENNWRERIWPLPASDLLFVGRSTSRKLACRNVNTIGDIAHLPVEYMQKWFGKNGVVLWRYANGLDCSRIMHTEYESPMKSVGHGITCSCDLTSNNDVWKVILELSQDVGRRLRLHGLAAQAVQLQIRASGLGFEQYQIPVSFATQSPLEIAQAAKILFEKRYRWNEPVRAVCVRAINLIPRSRPIQLDLFGDNERHARREQLDDCIDDIRRRFGSHSIISAALIGDLHMPDDGREKVKDAPHNCAQIIHIIPADPNFEKKRNSSALFAREINLVTQPSFDCEQGINSQVQTACSNADAIFPVLGIVSCRNERFSLSRKTHVPLWNEPRISHVRLL